MMCLGDDAAVNSAVDAMLQEDVKGKLIVDCSTVHPDTTNALEKKVTDKGAEFVGMPGAENDANLMHGNTNGFLQSSEHLQWQTMGSLSV